MRIFPAACSLSLLCYTFQEELPKCSTTLPCCRLPVSRFLLKTLHQIDPCLGFGLVLNTWMCPSMCLHSCSREISRMQKDMICNAIKANTYVGLCVKESSREGIIRILLTWLFSSTTHTSYQEITENDSYHDHVVWLALFSSNMSRNVSMFEHLLRLS
jgi:hypothetical protein